MSYYIRILCQSADEINPQDIITFVREGVFFDPEPRFELLDSEYHGWMMHIHYHADKRPITIAQNSLDSEIWQGELSDMIGVLASAGISELQQELSKYIAKTQQVIAIEIDQPGMTQEAWACVDALERAFAQRLDGVIFADEDGFYDANLRLILKL